MRSGGGGAAGPDWTARLTSSSTQSKGSVLRGKRFRLRVVTDAHLARLERDGGVGGETFAVLGDGTRVRTDLLVSAAGVDPAPRIKWLPIEKFPRGGDGGVAVDGSQRTLGPHASSVFAAGDCASCEHRELSMHSGDGTVNQWFQMRLWSQARQSGTFAARVRVFFGFIWFYLVIWFSSLTVCSYEPFVFQVMCGECDESAWGFNYELFTHQTTFFGMKCVFLGCYNGQKLGAVDEGDIRTYSRTGVDGDGNATFARVLLAKGVMRGAVLIGDVESAVSLF